jgi:small-conductance mechanosensitive channel
VSHRLFKAVYAAFTDEGIEIPFPQRVVTMGEDSAARESVLGSASPASADGETSGD